jgi:hypothetical protein
MFACSYGAAFGAIQQIPQIVPALPQVRDRIATATEDKPAPEARGIAGQIVQSTAAAITKIQEYGGLTGRLLLAIVVTLILSQRRLIRLFLFPGLILMPLVFGFAATSDQRLLTIGMFFIGLFTVGQFSFWGNYLPRVFPIHLRGTGESFAANIGGRMIGTSFALVASLLSTVMPVDTTGMSPAAADAIRMAAAATLIGTAVYLANIVLSFFLPEPAQDVLPE